MFNYHKILNSKLLVNLYFWKNFTDSEIGLKFAVGSKKAKPNNRARIRIISLNTHNQAKNAFEIITLTIMKILGRYFERIDLASCKI